MPKSVVSFPDLLKSFWHWWTRTNPEWRQRTESGFVCGREQGDWTNYIYAGRRGLLIALISLRWCWDLAACEEDLSYWRAALCDVYWVLNQIANHVE